MKKIICLAVVAALLLACSRKNYNNGDQQAELAGWITLFDGNSFNGWRGYGRTDVPAAWTIEGNTMKLTGAKSKKSGGDIIFDKKFRNFELSFEYKISQSGNSGVFYLAQEIPGQKIWKSAPEYQLLDDERHPDGKLGKNGNRYSGSLYDLIPASPKNAKPAEEWNTGFVRIKNGKVMHMQNGHVVVKYRLWTPEWRTMVDGSKFKGWTDFIEAGGNDRQGYIGFQDHGNDVWFRNIKIREL